MESDVLATIMVCKKCEFQSELGKLERPHSSLNFCPECFKANRGSILISLSVYKRQKLEEKLQRHIYCRNCGFIGLIDDFPFNGPREDHDSEKYCPKCISTDDLVNAVELTPCGRCHKKPAAQNEEWCGWCIEDYYRACEEESESF